MRQNQKGRIFSVLLTAFPLLDESKKMVGLATIAKDISLRKQMEKELATSRKHLQELSRKSIEALESDRRTTAKELHDGIGASLAAIKFRLEGIAKEIAQKPEKAAASLVETISYLQAAIKETKQILLEVADNGCGFDVQKTLSWENPLSGFGLASMIERAEIAEGAAAQRSEKFGCLNK